MSPAALAGQTTLPFDSRRSDDAADSYRVKLYKVATGQWREERERLRQEWDARNRARE